MTATEFIPTENNKFQKVIAIISTNGKDVNDDDPLPVNDVKNQKTAFDELSVAELSPVVQVQFPYNINTDLWEIRDNSGTASVVNNMANLSTGAGANQSSTILTKTPLKYNPGQGAVVRGTPLFQTGVSGNTQYWGIGNSTDGYFFGFEGSSFGILRRQGGKPETRLLQITTASDTTENIVITINGVAENVAVTASGGDTAANRVFTANEIAAHDWSNVGEGWEVHNMGRNILFTSFGDGAKNGTFEITTSTTVAGTFAQSLAGVSSTEIIIPQENWNIDRFDGTGLSGLTLDPTKGNVYQIRYQWLGFGAILFSIEHSDDGEIGLVHRINYANNNIIPSVDNPTLPLFAQSKNTSNTTDVVLKVGSMGGFVEGRDTLDGLPHGTNNTVTSISNVETPILTLHSHDIYQGTINRVKIKMESCDISVEGTKTSIVRIRKNAVLTGAVSFSPLNSNTSTIHVDTGATGVSGGIVVFVTGARKIDEIEVDLEKLGITLVAPDFLTLTVEGTAVTSIEALGSFNWQSLF